MYQSYSKHVQPLYKLHGQPFGSPQRLNLSKVGDDRKNQMIIQALEKYVCLSILLHTPQKRTPRHALGAWSRFCW